MLLYDAIMFQSMSRLIPDQSKVLVLQKHPDTLEVIKLDDAAAVRRRPSKDDVYLPAIRKASSLTSIPSYPYACDRRRRSSSSLVPLRKQSSLRAKKEARKSNVTVTMTYLGQGRRGSRDELKVLQQVNGGENICVFRDLVTPGETFQFVSQRHRGFPFSASVYVNGIKAARISSCCEYRYAPGSQQGRNSCFRLAWLSGGLPCYRCTSLRNKSSSCQQLNDGPPEQSSGKGVVESCPSSPLFIPIKPEKSTRRTRKDDGGGGGGGSTDGEDAVTVKEAAKKKKKKTKGHKGQSKEVKTSGNKRDGERSNVKCEDDAHKPQTSCEVTTRQTCRVLDSTQDVEVLSRPSGGGGGGRGGGEEEEEHKDPGSNGERLKDFYEECVEMSGVLEQRPSKHKWLKANILERCRLQKRLSSSSRPKAPGSDVEQSPESDSLPDGEPEEHDDKDTSSQNASKQEQPGNHQDLQAQLDAMMTVLSTSEEVEQLVLRNTDLTDDLLLRLAAALKTSRSEVTLLNLNLNLIGPYGAHVLLDVLRVKPHVRGLHLFGNKLRDHGLLALLRGLAELQQQTAASVQQALLLPAGGWSSSTLFVLQELDVGGNGLGSDGVRVLASYMRHHSRLHYLGLAQSGGADLAAWKELFDSLRGNQTLTRIILDQNELGDPGVRLLAGVLRDNAGLRQVDLDRNGISDVGGNDIMAALLCRTEFPLTHLSLQENHISAGLTRRIQEEVKSTLQE